MIVLATCPEKPVEESEVTRQENYNNQTTNVALGAVVNAIPCRSKAYGYYE